MKFWKVLAGLAAAAALIPYQVEKDEETGTLKLKALTWEATRSPNPEDGGTQVEVSILPGLSPVDVEDLAGPDEPAGDPEAEMFDDSVTLGDVPPVTIPDAQ